MADQQNKDDWKAFLQPIPGWEVAPVRKVSSPKSAPAAPVKTAPVTQPAQPFKLPHIKLPDFRVRDIFPKVSLPGNRRKWSVIGSCALALASLATVFSHHSTNTSTDTGDKIATGPIAATVKTDTVPALASPKVTPPPQTVKPPPVAAAPSQPAPAPPRAEKYSPPAESSDELLLAPPLKGFDLANYEPRRRSGFGLRNNPVTKDRHHHSGVDIPARSGTPVFAMTDGVVKSLEFEYSQNGPRRKKYKNPNGNAIELSHPGYLRSFYAHLSDFAQGIRPGTPVKQGDLIGYVGSTGRSTGPHLHLEISKAGIGIDPVKVASLSMEEIQNNAGILAKIPGLRRIFSHAHDDNIKRLIGESADREGLNPDLIYRLFVKEAGRNRSGLLNTNARSDRGAEGLCQFIDQQFLSTMKRHGPRLGYQQYADAIGTYVGRDNRTYYTAGKNTEKILNLRSNPEIAVPLCAAHIKEDLGYLKAEVRRPLNFTDSSLAHFLGRAVAAPIIRAYDNPATRRDWAYKYAQPVNFDGPTNRSVFFENGNRNRPYTVEEVYHAKRSKMGTALAFNNTPASQAYSNVQFNPR